MAHSTIPADYGSHVHHTYPIGGGAYSCAAFLGCDVEHKDGKLGKESGDWIAFAQPDWRHDGQPHHRGNTSVGGRECRRTDAEKKYGMALYSR